MLDRDIAAVDPAQLPQPLDQGACLENPEQVIRGAGRGGEIADAANPFGWLRAPPDREHDRQSADQRNYIAAPHSPPRGALAAASRGDLDLDLHARVDEAADERRRGRAAPAEGFAERRDDRAAQYRARAIAAGSCAMTRTSAAR